MPRPLDLKEQKFGKLIALERAPKRNDRYTRWICQCECGNLVEVRTDYLRNGHTTSCGCIKEKFFRELDLIGQQFGRLKVLDNLPGGKKKCQCECGNIIEVETSNLTSGNTKSCGCLQKDRTSEASLKNLIGQRYGKLTVIERASNNRFNHVCWKCQCDCGGITIVDATNLRNGNTTSCGCIKSKGEMIINNWLKEHNINYQSQYSFNNFKLKSGRSPYFDFAIFDNENNLSYLIEYDGKQHFEYSGYGWDNKENFKRTQDRDNQKNEWCKIMNIKLYRISYKDDIEKCLEGIVKAEAEAPDMEEAQEA